MLQSWNIKQLYALALAEGEGVGTAYEYYVKRLALKKWLARRPAPQSILMAGLPETYGCSLDICLLAHEYRASLTVIDDRSDHLEKSRQALAISQAGGLLINIQPTYRQLNDWRDMPWRETVFDLVICSEVVQRLDPGTRLAYAAGLKKVASAAAVFCPNAENDAHVGLSGLNGLHLDDLRRLWPAAASGFIDMPPFPPGIIRSEEQREQATSGRLEGFAMWGLGGYARLEQWLPLPLRRRFAHIVYAFS